MTPFQIETIELLRDAARVNKGVACLLGLLAEVLVLDEAGNQSICANQFQADSLKAVILAAEFAKFDRDWRA